MYLKDEIKHFHYQRQSMPIPGSFAIDCYHDEGYYSGIWPGWQTCREVMQLFFRTHHPGIWFSFPPEELNDVVHFMSWVELTLAIPYRSEIYRSNHDDIVYIGVSDWWRSCEMRKNAFTMFLRCARSYATLTGSDKNYKNALLSYPYSRNTMPAIERFLLGFTRYTGAIPQKVSPSSGHINQGWNATFNGKDMDFARSLLVSP
jgi:hypothetical protein